MRLAPGNAIQDHRAARADEPVRRKLDVRNSLGPASEPRPTPDLHFQQLIRILHRQIGLIIAVAALGTLLTGAAALLVPPKYTAKAQIVVEPQQTGVVIGQAPVALSSDGSAIDTQVTMLTSQDYLLRVLDNLSEDPEFRSVALNAGTETAAPVINAPDEDISSRSVGAEKPTDAIATKAGTLSLDDLERYLTVSRERSSRVIGVSFTSTTAKKAAIVANRVAQLYVESQRRQKRGNTSRELARLDERIAELKD